MQYKQLGETGLIVSRLAFGAMTFTPGDRAALDEMTKPRPAPLSWLELTMDEQTRKAFAPEDGEG